MKTIFILSVLLLLSIKNCFGQQFWVEKKIDSLQYRKDVLFIFVQQWDSTYGENGRSPEYDTARVVKFISKFIDSAAKDNSVFLDSAVIDIELTMRRQYGAQSVSFYSFSIGLDAKSIAGQKERFLSFLKNRNYKDHFSKGMSVKNYYKPEKWFTNHDLNRWLKRLKKRMP